MTTNLEQLTPAQLRRVDAMLAEKVCGLEVGRYEGYRSMPGTTYVCRMSAQSAEFELPHYTTDPAAALGLLVSRPYCIEHFPGEEVEYSCMIYPGYHGDASTLPLAIVGAVVAAEGLELGEVVGE